MYVLILLFSVLVLGKSSMGALNDRLAIPLPIDRFRANIIVDGTNPFEEDRSVILF